jgi:predicted outer membrane repeat protein
LRKGIGISLFLLAIFIGVQNIPLNADMPSRQSLITNSINGNPLFNFDIAIGSGENYADGSNPSGDDFFWTLVPQHIDAIKNAGDYWAILLGALPQNSSPVTISMGIYNYLNDDAISDYGANGNGLTTLANAILFDNTADYYEPYNPNYTQRAYAQIRIGALVFPFLDFMGQSFEQIEYIWGDTSAWSFKPMELLPNNHLIDGMVPVIIHEMAHAMGIMSFEYFRGDGKLYFLEYDGVNLNKFDQKLVDSFGTQATVNQVVRLADSNEGLSSDFRVIRQGDPALNDSEIGGFAFFQGSNVMSVLSGAIHKNNNPNNIGGIPINGFEGSDSDLSHLELRNSMMSHQNYRNWNTFMEAELALFQDIGIALDRKNMYGHSIYNDDIAYINISANFYARNLSATDYLNGQYNSTSYTIGLHIYGTTNTVEMRGEVLSNGSMSAGIRIDGWNNKLTIFSNIHSDGQKSAALLVSYGKDHKIIHQGTLSAIGDGGIGARFDFGDNILGDMYEFRGSYMRRHANFDPYAGVNPYWNPFYWNMDDLLPELEGALVEKFDITGSISGAKAAIYIAPNAFVKEINIMSGAQISGDIISDWSPSFDFNQITDIFHYVQYYWFAGWWINGQPVMTLGDLNDLKTKLTFGYRKNAAGEKTSQIDASFNFNYSGNIKAGGGYSMDIDIVGGNLNLSGSISGIANINKTSNGLFTMSGDGSVFNGVFNQSAGITTFNLDSKMFSGENNISNSILNINASSAGYKLNIGSDALLNHYNTYSDDWTAIGGSNIKFTGINGKAVFDSYSPASYKVKYKLSAPIYNANFNTVSFKNASLKFPISDYTIGSTLYSFENSHLDLRDGLSTRTVSFPNIAVSASSLSINLFYSGENLYGDSLQAASGSGFLYLDGISLSSFTRTGIYWTKILSAGSLQFYNNDNKTFQEGRYIYSFSASSWTGGYADSGYFWLKTKVSLSDLLLALNSQSGNRIFDMSADDIQEYGSPYFISESLGAAASGDFKIIGDTRFVPTHKRNSISGLIFQGGGAQGSFFDLSNNTVLTIENIQITSANAQKGSVLYAQNPSSLSIFKDIVFQNNTAQKGGAVYLSNGAIVKAQSGSYGDNFIKNTASEDGGVFYIDRSTVEFESRSLNFISNTAANRGGAVYMSGDSVDFAFLTIKAKQSAVLFSENKADSKPNDIYMENFSKLILDADKANITMKGGISAPNNNNFIEKNGNSNLILDGITNFQGEFKINKGTVVFSENSQINIKDLIVGLPSAPNHPSAFVEVLSSSANIDNLTISSVGKFSMSDNQKRKTLYAQNIDIFGTLELAIDASSGVLGISDIIHSTQMKIEADSRLIIKAYGIGSVEALIFDSYLDNPNNLWQSGSIVSEASKGNWTISNAGGSQWIIRVDIKSALSSIAGLTPTQNKIVNFFDGIDNNDILKQKIISPLTMMSNIEDIARAINQLGGLIYYKTLSIGASDDMAPIIYSNISASESANGAKAKKAKKKKRNYLFMDMDYDSFLDNKEPEEKNNETQQSIPKAQKIIKNSFWADVNYSALQYKNEGNEGDFNLDGFGFSIGTPLFLQASNLFGIYAGISLKTAKESLDKADIRDIRLGFYSAHLFSNVLLKANLGLGLQDFSVKRTIDYSGDTIYPNADWTSYSLNLSAQAQLPSLTQSINLYPYIGFSLGFSQNPKITEENGLGRELIIEEAVYTKLAPNAGFSLEVPIENLKWTLRAGISYVVLGGEFNRDISYKEFSQYGSISDISTETDTFLGQVGTVLYYDFSGAFSLGINFDADISQNAVKHITHLNAIFKF